MQENDERVQRPVRPMFPFGWLLVGVVAVFMVVLGIVFFVDEDTVGPETGVSVDELVQNETDYIGETVTVSAQVENRVSPYALSLNAPGVGEDVLVVSARGFQAQGGGEDEFLFDENEAVRVTGTVRSFNLNEIEQDLGIDLDEAEFEQYEGSPVIVAQSVNRINEEGVE